MRRFFVVLAFGLMLCAPAFGQVQLKRSVIGNGGALITDGNIVLNATLGQAAIGVTVDPNLQHFIGFWYGLLQPEEETVIDVTDLTQVIFGAMYYDRRAPIAKVVSLLKNISLDPLACCWSRRTSRAEPLRRTPTG